jgi:hypothetical protein
MRKRKAVSPVIATVIISAFVLIVGGMMWQYSMSASSILADDYINETIEGINVVNERFLIEHIEYYSSNNTIGIWVYNYGELFEYGRERNNSQSILINIDVYTPSYPDNPDQESGLRIQKGDSEKIMIALTESVSTGDIVTIEVNSWRQNNVQKRYFIP